MKCFWKKNKVEATSQKSYEDFRITTVYVKNKTYKVEVVDPDYYSDPYWYPSYGCNVVNVYKLNDDCWVHEFRRSIEWNKNKDSADLLKQRICELIEIHENELKRKNDIKALDGQSIDCKCEEIK